MTLPRRQVVLCSLGAVWIVAALAMWLAWPRHSIEGTWESAPGPTSNVFRITFGPKGAVEVAFNGKMLVKTGQEMHWSKRSGPALCNQEAGKRTIYKFKLLPPDAKETTGYSPMEGDVYWINEGMFFVFEDGCLLQNQGLILERVTPLTRLKRWFREQIGES